MVRAAVGRIWSRMPRKPSTRGVPTADPSCAKPSTRATTSTRMRPGKERTSSSTCPNAAPITNCAAPITSAVPSAVTQPEHFVLDEKGTALVTASASTPRSRPNSRIARAVSFASASFAAAIVTAACAASPRTSATSMAPVVMVPVLSRQSTSTRASVSTQYDCCTSTLLDARRVVAMANTLDVKSTSPCGIMPTTAATVCSTASLYP